MKFTCRELGRQEGGFTNPARTANGVRQECGYDARGRLLSVREGGEEVERYAYDSPRTGIRVNPCPSVDDSKYVAMTCATVGTKSRRRYTAAALTTAFGESVRTSQAFQTFFTGKPQVEGLGYAFLYRNYRADLAKWQTADPLGYPDGWNQLAYCGNEVTRVVDLFGAMAYDPAGLTSDELDELNRALSIYSIGGVTVGGLFDGRPLTRSFFFRYIWKLGDQELAYSEISGEKVLQEKKFELLSGTSRMGNMTQEAFLLRALRGHQWICRVHWGRVCLVLG